MDYLTKQFLISRAQSPEGPQLLPGASASFLIKFIYTRKGCERYFRQPQPDRMLSHSSKKAVRVEGEITFTPKEAESFPYFLNMQKILCLEGDGHAWHRDVILLGCAVPDVGPNCKCNRFCLKRDGRKNRKKRNKGGLPFSRSITKTHSKAVGILSSSLVPHHKATC